MRVSAGQPFDPRASDWNSFLETAEAERARRMGRETQNFLQGLDPNYALVTNGTTATVKAGGVIGLSARFYNPAEQLAQFRDRPIIKGELPAAQHRSRFAIYVRDCVKDEAAEALLSGVYPVKVNVTSPHHRYARPTVGDTGLLTSDWWGGAELLYPAVDPGEQWLYVRLGVQAWPVYEGKTLGPFTKNTTAAVGYMAGVAGSKTYASVDIANVFNGYVDLGAAKRCHVAFVPGGPDSDGGPELVAGDCVEA